MDIAFKPTLLPALALGALFVVSVLAALLKRMAPWKKIATIVFTAVVCGGLAFFFSRTTHLVIDDEGIRTDTYGRISIPWSAVEKAALVDDLGASSYALKARTNGVALGDYRAGWFTLSDGRTAFVTMETGNRALVIEADGKPYVFGPREADAFLEAVSRHVTVAR
jgi:hypothetical protein